MEAIQGSMSGGGGGGGLGREGGSGSLKRLKAYVLIYIASIQC